MVDFYCPLPYPVYVVATGLILVAVEKIPHSPPYVSTQTFEQNPFRDFRSIRQAIKLNHYQSLE